MKTEFIILVPEADTFCDTKLAFIALLNVDALISVANGRIVYKTTTGEEVLSANFVLDMGDVKAKKERYFRVAIECDDTTSIEEFAFLCERVKLIASRLAPGRTAINTMWNDVGSFYAKQAYPVIHNVENLMRKLIETFMLLNVGIAWSADSMHPDLLKKVRADGDGELNVNDMHKLDFIQLNDFLFGQKRDLDINDLDKLLRKNELADHDLVALRRYLPQSNWEKYFSQVIKEKESSLKEKWSRLYKLRNKVAHNRSVTKKDFDEIRGLSAKIETIAQQAIEKLGEIKLNEEERKSIIDSFHSDGAPFALSSDISPIINYYSERGFSISREFGNTAFDFAAISGESAIGIEIKYLNSSIPYSLFRQMLAKELPISQRSAQLCKLSGIHRIYVLRDRLALPLKDMAEFFDIACAVFGDPPVEIHFGIVEKGSYISGIGPALDDL